MSNFMKIHLSILYVIIILFTNTACWNTTYDFISLKKDSFKTKSERFLSFDTTDDDLKIELEFSVPFLEIPIKKSVDFAKNVVAKVNLPSLVLTGLIVFISTIFLPSIMFIVKKFHMTNQFMDTNGSNETYRGLNLDEMPLWRYAATLDNILLENNIDVTSCIQRSICDIIHKSKMNILNQNASSIEKIIDGLISNKWILDKIYNTPFYSAINNGLNSSNCNEEYRNCKMSQAVNILFEDIINFLGT